MDVQQIKFALLQAIDEDIVKVIKEEKEICLSFDVCADFESKNKKIVLVYPHFKIEYISSMKGITNLIEREALDIEKWIQQQSEVYNFTERIYVLAQAE